jgi:hypothetical protein
VVLQFSTESKIPNFHLHFAIKEHITQLHISVNDSLLMQVLQSIDKLQQIALRFELGDSDSRPEEF